VKAFKPAGEAATRRSECNLDTPVALDRGKRIFNMPEGPRVLKNTSSERTSPKAKMFGYGVIALLLLAIVLLATGAVRFGAY
jgi:hypothetical protein